jgi:hypothetical protein
MSATRSLARHPVLPVLLVVLCACDPTAEPYDQLLVQVSVTAAGTGKGEVGSSFPYLSCSFDAGRFVGPYVGAYHNCHASFEDAGGGGRFEITAYPAPGSVLAGWTGDCTWTGNVCNATFFPGERSVAATVRFDLAETPPAPPVAVIADSFEVGDRWDFRIVASSGVATQLPTAVASGGNPGGFRRMEHRIDGMGSIQVFHRYTGATYSPSTSGAIASLTYSEHRILFDPPFLGAGVAAGLALEQGGQLYTLNFGGYTNLTWQLHERTRIVANDFSPAPGPDFSASGAPIRFGYVRGNSNTSTGLQRVHHGIDNWRVEIHRQ